MLSNFTQHYITVMLGLHDSRILDFNPALNHHKVVDTGAFKLFKDL